MPKKRVNNNNLSTQIYKKKKKRVNNIYLVSHWSARGEKIENLCGQLIL